MFKIIAVTVAGLALAGCNYTASAWQKPGISVAQSEQDFKQCQYEAVKATPEGNGGLSDGPRINQLRSTCMELKGYGRV